jgi:bacterioferritin-associated ferredoxin
LIVCSCNVLSDQDVRSAVSASADLPRTARQVYGCLGCSAECGRCARTINKIIKDALGACAKECATGCPHASHHAESRDFPADGSRALHVHQAATVSSPA